MVTKSHNKGISLATALVLGALALTLAFTLAGMSFSHLSVSTRLSNISQARALAEATLAQAIERVVSSEGEYFQAAPFDHTVSMAHLPGGRGRLTFDPAQAASWDIPLSVNNLKGEVSTLGHNGRMVPSKSIHFVAVGEFAGVSKRMEAVLNVPTYKYALSSEGAISSVGAMIVASADNPADVLPSALSKLDQLLPGHILSNSSDPSYALDLNGGSGNIVVTGDAKAVGGIYPEGGSLDVQGSLRPNSDPSDMPVIEVNDFDPAHFGATQGFANPPNPVEVADGIFRHNGNLNLQELRLPTNNTGAIVWVNGDLRISEGVSGVGALFATGDIIIDKAGQASVTADNVLAVVAGKRLEVRGSGVDSAFFQGVLASGDATVFEEVTVLGAVVVGSTEVGGVSVGSPNPPLTLTNANMINIPQSIGFDFKYPFNNGVGGVGFSGSGFGWSAPNVPVGHPQMSMDIRGRGGEPNGGDAMELAHFYDAASDSFVESNWGSWDGFTPYNYDPATHTRSGSPFGFFVNDSDPATPGNQAGFLTTRAQLIGIYTSIEANYPPIVSASGGSYATWADYFANEPVTDMNDLIDRTIDYAVHGDKNFEEAMQLANDAYDDELEGQSQETATFTMDPNQYINWDSRTKILLWRDL